MSQSITRVIFQRNKKQLVHPFFYGTVQVYCASMNMQQIRLRNLAFILDQRFGGVIARLARAVDKSPNHMRVVLHPEKPGGRAIGENLARQLEEKLGLLTHVLDIEDENLYRSHILSDATGAQDRSADHVTGKDALALSARVYPLITWSQAGTWRSISEKQRMNPASWHVCHKDLGAKGYVLRVEDESMRAPGSLWSFQAGMLLYVNADATPKHGQFVIVRRGGTDVPVFRRLVLIDGDSYLEACNPDWPKRYSPMTENDVFCGVVTHAALELA